LRVNQCARETTDRWSADVVRLIHLNGPPGIGKSTIAAAFAGRNPGVLNPDIDSLAAMIGSYGDSFSDSLGAATLPTAPTGRVHLTRGHDVIMPQVMTHLNAGELAGFEAATAAARAEYLQILLRANVEPAIEGCMERAKAADSRHDVVSKVIGGGGRDFLRVLHAQVTVSQALSRNLQRGVVVPIDHPGRAARSRWPGRISRGAARSTRRRPRAAEARLRFYAAQDQSIMTSTSRRPAGITSINSASLRNRSA
jgi:hypothetical protein